MRLGFAIAVHVRADVLLLDEVFAVGDEAFQRKCVDRILEFKQQGGTVCFVSHAAPAVEQLCERAVLLQHGRVEYDGETEEALRRYHAQLARRRAPRRSASSCASRGRGELRVDGLARRGRRRRGARPLRLRRAGLDPAAARGGRGDSRRPALARAARPDAARCSARARPTWRSSAGTERPGIGELRFSVERLPLAEGTFQLGVTLVDADGSRRYHRVDRAAQFIVSGSDDARGPLLLRGRVDAGRDAAEGGRCMSSRTCPDWPELTELAPDLQFKHYTVAEARLPADALVQLGDFPLGAVAICADLDKNVFYAQHTDPKVAEALRDTHWYEVREWATTGPGANA